jgi:isoleucyl-tRNA synthetase
LQRERDILDVWFDSGSSHEAVLARYPELGWPADMYLEGSDQHRGWFQSSLLIALGTRERPPYREVLTHGFLIDLEGRKMSKSVGNAIVPQDVIKESGAEILRLWVAMSDYAEELRVSKEILTRVVDAYRKLRNTCRILAANLYDFDPAKDAVPVDKLSSIDRYALARYGEGAQKMLRAYEEYDFPTVFQTLNSLATVDLSAFYVDVTKDRMYTFAARSFERRSTQTVMYLICEGLARLIAPILPVTADDLWRNLPGSRSESVHLEDFPQVDRFVDDDTIATWERLLAVREAVNAALEQQRKDKVIGNSLGARVILTASGPITALLDRFRHDLPMLFIVSDLALHLGPAEGADQISVAVEKAPGVKCERCWRYVPSTHSEPEWAGICDRCVDALAEPVNR